MAPDAKIDDAVAGASGLGGAEEGGGCGGCAGAWCELDGSAVTKEGGDGGGEIVATGTPEDVAKVKRSHTGTYLAPILKKTATQKAPKTTTKKTSPKPKKRTNQRPKAAE